MSTPGGLRERKKEATRTALHEAAVRLTVERGLDDVTVEEIADAAGVSRRTFSNYFAGKEDALLYGDEQRLEKLLETFEAGPPGDSAWTALRGALHVLYEGQDEPDPQWAVKARLAKRHPSVLGRQLAHFAAFERRLAAAVAARDGLPETSVRARAMAAAFLTALRVGSLLWTDQQSGRPLRALVDEALDEMAAPFS
ncbi:TetR/AcrR family transcriptional regulator [Actinomadura sp. 21ATH]|uniref:TetR/AcrR family transcriptional regulator n=1 Tax=Actinomadura sp. 21ATH TaxID=1735444 RepID=UPI0035C01B45